MTHENNKKVSKMSQYDHNNFLQIHETQSLSSNLATTLSEKFHNLESILRLQTSKLSDKPSRKEDSASWILHSSSLVSTSEALVQTPFSQIRKNSSWLSSPWWNDFGDRPSTICNNSFTSLSIHLAQHKQESILFSSILLDIAQLGRPRIFAVSWWRRPLSKTGKEQVIFVKIGSTWHF